MHGSEGGEDLPFPTPIIVGLSNEGVICSCLQRIIMQYQIEDYDFLDFGASKGNSILFGKNKLGGRKGLGIDNDPNKVELAKENGIDCILEDVTKLKFPINKFNFIIMSHFLEHLGSFRDVRRTIESAAQVAKNFLFIQGPFFDADGYLESLGLKFFWSDWTAHHTQLTIKDLRLILLHLGLNKHIMLVANEVLGSDHPTIHPLESPKNQQDYDPQKHPPKPNVRFTRTLYREMVCIVKLREFGNWKKIIKAKSNATNFSYHSWLMGVQGNVRDKSSTWI